jgi:hypothetical protein
VLNLLRSTFANNPLSIVITVIGVLYAGDKLVVEPFQEWQKERQNKKQQEALTTRCNDRVEAQNEIREQADKARSSSDNSFINQ